MDIFEKTKLALREYIKENPKKVKKDLDEMRAKSTIGWEAQLGIKKDKPI